MEKTLEELRKELDAARIKAAQYQHQLERLENRSRYIANGDRRKRAHRLITRGAAVESIAPAVKTMGETEFYSMMEEILSLPVVTGIIAQATGEGG